MRVRPQIMLVDKAHEAIALWRSAFPEIAVEPIAVDDDDRITHAELRLGGLDFLLFDSPVRHDFGPTPSHSLVVEVTPADEVDRLAATLGEGGTVLMPIGRYDFADRFVWLTDRFGVSWQISCEVA